MKVESSIKENYSSTATPPITNIGDIINAICEWNGITLNDFTNLIGTFREIGKDSNGNPLYMQDDRLVNPIGMYLLRAYDGKQVVFEKGNDKFFGTLRVRADSNIRYQLGEKVIEIPFRIKAVNEDTDDSITIFPKTSDIIQGWMKGMYVVNTGWAERQRIEKEIMAKLVELSQVRGGNEIISTQNMIEEMKTNLNKRGINLELTSTGVIFLKFPRRKLRDTANNDREYIAPPITISIDFDNRTVQCNGYSPHGFGTPNSWGNPCWGNWDNDIRTCLRDCSFKGLVNLIISWAYGYNSNDTGLSHSDRHPVAKLRDYVWWAYENRNTEDTIKKKEIEKMREHFEEIKETLNLDNWLDGCSGVKEFLEQFDVYFPNITNNETAE